MHWVLSCMDITVALHGANSIYTVVPPLQPSTPSSNVAYKAALALSEYE